MLFWACGTMITNAYTTSRGMGLGLILEALDISLPYRPRGPQSRDPC